MRTLRRKLRIVALTILVAALFGISFDMVTAHVCVEYFSVAHPHVLPLSAELPVPLALFWGVAATWWLGAFFGVCLALAGDSKAAPLSVKDQLVALRPVALAIAAAAMLAWPVGYLLAAHRVIYLLEPVASEVSRTRHPLLIGDGFAHSAAYLFGFLGMSWLVFRRWRACRQAGKAAASNLGSTSPEGPLRK